MIHIHLILKKGLAFYLDNFFLLDGTPKYYHDKMYPIDIHCPGQLWVTLFSLDEWCENKELCKAVCQWTINNMQDKKRIFLLSVEKRH